MLLERAPIQRIIWVICRLRDKNSLALLVSECYNEAELSARTRPSFASLSPEVFSPLALVATVSKTSPLTFSIYASQDHS